MRTCFNLRCGGTALVIIASLTLCTETTAQTTAIPDNNFEQALIDLGIDSDATLNGQVLTADIIGISSLNVYNENISDLTGIADFAALQYLDCGFNNLSALDLTFNSNLITLRCINNDLISIDVSGLSSLDTLDLLANDLVSLDVSTNPMLRQLSVASNPITELELWDNANLSYLVASFSQLTRLDLRYNTMLESVQITNTPSLTSMNIQNGNNTNIDGSLFNLTGSPNACVAVDDSTWSEANWFLVPGAVTFTNGSCESDEFVLSLQTTTMNHFIGIPTPASGYDFYVDWGDGNIDSYSDATSINPTHSYTTPGTYTLRIGGDFPRVAFGASSNTTQDALMDIEQWGAIQWSSMQDAFRGCPNLTVSATDKPDLNGCTSLQGMFRDCSSMNGPVGHWDVSGITHMNRMFQNCSAFDQSLADWNLSSVTNMNIMLNGSALSLDNYDSTLIGWATLDVGETLIPSGINLGAGGLDYCLSLADRLELINTYGWTFSGDAWGCVAADEFVTTWQTTTANESITIPTIGSGYDYYVDWGDGTMTAHRDTDPSTDATHVYASAGLHTVRIGGDFPRIRMFTSGEELKLLDIVQWGNIQWSSMQAAFFGCNNLQMSATDAPDLSQCSNLQNMFRNCFVLDAPVDHWNMSTAKNTSFMFRACYAFDQPLALWDVSGVTDMRSMFALTQSFDQDLSAWDVSSVQLMGALFEGAQAFDQSLGDWDISSVSSMPNMLRNASLSILNYDSTLIGWATLEAGETQIPTGLDLDADGLIYCTGANAHQDLIDTYGWTIDGDSALCDPDNRFITTWQTTAPNESITIPTTGSGYNYFVDWGDGSMSLHSDADANTDATHIYATPGIYTVSIDGQFPRIYSFNAPDRLKIIDVSQWGSIQWTSMASAFRGCNNLEVSATDAPDLSLCTSMNNIFRGCHIMNAPLDHWDVGNVVNMFQAFRETQDFNHPLDSWDVSKVDNMAQMFLGCHDLDQDFGSWDISSVIDMDQMLDNTGLSVSNYDSTLTGWAILDAGETVIPSGITLGSNGLDYCNGAFDRMDLINTYGWTISGDAMLCTPADEFVTTWQTTAANESITIPTTGSGYAYYVDWGDGTITYHGDTSVTTDASHIYASAGPHTVRIAGDLPRIYFNNAGDDLKITDIGQWGSNAWKSMAYAFFGCSNLQMSAFDAPDLSQCTNMNSMLRICHQFNSPIDHWDVGTIINMNDLFRGCQVFDQDLNSWDVSNVTSMVQTFGGAVNFNGNISSWAVGNVQSLSNMFTNASDFNRDISGWDVSNVSSFHTMFQNALSFNQDIGDWDVSNASSLFAMFTNAPSFDQNLAEWDISNVNFMANMLSGSGLSQANYDSTLIGWATLDVDETAIPTAITLDANGLTFCASFLERQALIDDHGWTISGDGLGCDPLGEFVTTWQTTIANESITIPTTGSGYAYYVDWGDGSISAHSDADASTDATHVYATAGTYTVRIGGEFPQIHFNNGGDKDKIFDVTQWGNIEWASMFSAFRGCTNLQATATDAPDLSNCTSMSSMFRQCSAFNSPIGHWNVGTITNMSNLFRSASLFNQPIGLWNVGQVTTMSNMFTQADAFDQYIGDWTVGALTNMAFMFFDANQFDQDIGGWDVSGLSNMRFTFSGAYNFDQDISGWDVGNVVDMESAFLGATSFDQNLGDWDISNVTDMNGMLTISAMSTANYDSTLIGWATLDVGETAIPSGLSLGAGGLAYCTSFAERQDLIDTYGWTITDAGLDPNCDIRCSLRVFLEGPYDDAMGLMHDSLRAQGLLPTTEPYTGLGWTHVGGGGETTPISTFDVQGNDAIVDWVFLQLRDKSDNTLVVETRSALIQRDGDIVDMDGTSPVGFNSTADDYFIALYHRNHLGAMTLNTVALSSTTANIDLSDGSTVTFGVEAQADINGTNALWSGDAMSDGVVKYTGLDNDRDPILVEIGGAVPTNTTSGYRNTDVNMDGEVKYTGAENDRDIILQNIGGVVPTNTRIEQMP